MGITDPGIPWDEFALCTVRAARGTGTGFAFLKPHWIVTARHVVAGHHSHKEILFIFPAPRREPGLSGSPLLARDGSVIGVVVDGITFGGQRMVRATSIAPVVDMMLEMRS